jgi:hypothetical protein
MYNAQAKTLLKEHNRFITTIYYSKLCKKLV